MPVPATVSHQKRREVNQRLNGPQFRAWQALKPHRTVFCGFGRGVGKSWFLRFCWYLLVAEWEYKVRTRALKPFRGVRITVLMPTLTQFRDVHWSAIETELGPDGEWSFLGAKLDRTRCQITFPGGSTIKPFPASAYNARTARGMRTDVLCCDEIDDIDAEVYDAVAVPFLSEPWSLGIELLVGTPTRGRHGLWFRSLQAGRNGEKVRLGEAVELDPEDAEALRSVFAFHATYRDAPETVSPRAVAKAKATTNPATFKREWEADPDAGEGLVYPFDESFHVREPHPTLRFGEQFICVDHGYSDPGVFLRCGVLGHGNDAIVWVIDEIHEREKPNSFWNDKARELIAGGCKTFFCDPSRPDRIADFCNLGANAIGADNNIDAGIARVANLLFIRSDEDGTRRARLFVSPRCSNTIREFGLYRRKKATDGSFQEDVEDKHNHCLEAGTIVSTRRGGVPIESVIPGDSVMTRKGWRTVSWSGQTFDNAELWEATTEAGSVTGTAEHRVWTENRGWVRLDSLRYGDIVLSWENTASRSPANTTARRSGDTRIRQTPTPDITGDHSWGGTCTASSGKSISAQSLTDTTFTTGTATRSTTTYGTSTACLQKSIFPSMGFADRKSGAQLSVSTAIESAHSQQRGTVRKLAVGGTVSTDSGFLEIESPSPTSVSSAGQLLKPESSGRRASAPTGADPLGGAPLVSMMSTADARSAGRLSESTDTSAPKLVPVRVLGSRAAGRSAAVYDLTVDGEHEFFANGILVHNCMDALRYGCIMRFGRFEHGGRHVGDAR